MIPLYIVDAFTGTAFSGNQAGVVILHKPAEEKWMQLVARELGFSETAFVHPLTPGEVYTLRWFTPVTEVTLCGHTTLAASRVLFQEKYVTGERITFETMSGKLYAGLEGEMIRLDFPADAPQVIEKKNRICEAFELEDVQLVAYAPKNGYMMIQIPKEKTVRELTPNMNLIRKTELTRLNGVIITARSRSNYDFVSRFFAPWEGVDEDPVTGSAHTVLTPFWAKVLRKQELKAYQASARGGELIVRLKDNDRVELLGSAVIVVKGDLLV